MLNLYYNLKKKNLKRKMNSNTIMFENVNVKNSNARIFIMFYIDDTTLSASILILKSLFKFESFLKIKNKTSTRTQTKERSSGKKRKKFRKTNKKANR